MTHSYSASTSSVRKPKSGPTWAFLISTIESFNMKTTLIRAILSALLVFSAPAFSAEDDWFAVTNDIGIKLSTVNAGANLVTAIIRLRIKESWTIHRIAIRRSDCNREYGTVYFFNPGNDVIDPNVSWSFAFGVRNLASVTSELLCSHPWVPESRPTL